MPSGGADGGAVVYIGVAPFHQTVGSRHQPGQVDRDKRHQGREQGDNANVHGAECSTALCYPARFAGSSLSHAGYAGAAFRRLRRRRLEHTAGHPAAGRRHLFRPLLPLPALPAFRPRPGHHAGPPRHPQRARGVVPPPGPGRGTFRHHGPGQYLRGRPGHCRRRARGGVLDVDVRPGGHRHQILHLHPGGHVPGRRQPGPSAGRPHVHHSRGPAARVLSTRHPVFRGRPAGHTAHLPGQPAHRPGARVPVSRL